MCGKLLKDWFQTSLILSPVLSLIIGAEPVLYTMPVLVDTIAIYKNVQFYVSDRRGRLCSVSHVRLGHTGTLAYSSFRWKGINFFNSMPMRIRNITACPPLVFKKQLDLYLSPILDCPGTPNFNNSLDNKYQMINCTMCSNVHETLNSQ